MNTIELVPASRLSLGELTAVLNAGYADYFVPAHQTEAQVARSLRAWDIDLDGSTVACAGDSAVGIVLVGVRGSQGWIGSLAVVPAWRRHRVGRHLMVHVQALARTRGLATLDLEVLTRNAPALTLYLALGFSIQRELLVWQRPAEQGALPDPFMKLQPIDPAWAVDHSPSWHNTAPCWQRDAASLRQLAADVQAGSGSAAPARRGCRARCQRTPRRSRAAAGLSPASSGQNRDPGQRAGRKQLESGLCRAGLLRGGTAARDALDGSITHGATETDQHPPPAA